MFSSCMFTICVFPTHVGMNRGLYGGPYGGSGIPHACGDEPMGGADILDISSYSPRMWGWGIPSAAGTQKSPAWKFHTGRALRAGAVSLSGRGGDVFAD